LTVSTQKPPPEDEWISQADAARLRGVSRQAISKLIKRGRLRTTTVAGYVLVHRLDVLSFEPQQAGRPRKHQESDD
jgi:biotin operon repressor